MPENVLLINYEPVIPNWLYKRSDSMSGNVLAIDDEALEKNEAAAMTEPQANDADVTQLAPLAELPMSPTQALTTPFDMDADSDTQGSSDKATRLASGETRQGFRVGELRFMIRYEDASELSEVPHTHRVPNAPDWFCGLANLQGQLIPVFDLAAYFGVDPNPQARRMLLVLLRAKDATGVLIDGLPERLRCSQAQYNDASVAPERFVPYLHGIGTIDEQLWFDLNPHALLDAIEQSLTIPQ